MIVCSCAVISDTDIEQALIEILSQPGAPLPTPGVVYRHLEKKMVCCGCAPLAVSTIYQKIDELAEQGVVCPYACACAQGRLLKGANDTPALQLIAAPADPAPARRDAGCCGRTRPGCGRVAGARPSSGDYCCRLRSSAARAARNFSPFGVTFTAILPPSTRSRTR